LKLHAKFAVAPRCPTILRDGCGLRACTKRLKNNLELLGQLQQEVAPTSTGIREKGATEPLSTQELFISLFPILLKHHGSLLRSVLSASEPLPIYKMGDDGIEKTFDDFNLLLNSCRRYVDTAS